MLVKLDLKRRGNREAIFEHFLMNLTKNLHLVFFIGTY